MSVEDVQKVIDALSERLQRSVAVDDHTLRLVAVGRDFGEADPARIWTLLHRQTRPEDIDYAHLRTATEPTRVAANAELELVARWCIPVRLNRMLLGFMWIIDGDASLTIEALDDVVQCSEVIASLLHRRFLITDRQTALETYLVDGILGTDLRECRC